jgi:hypothetical protein
MNWKLPLTAFVIILLSPPAVAEESDALTGSFGFDREDDACPKLGTCTISFQINGAAAKAIYNKMRVKAVADECTGGLVKEDGQGMRCYKEDSGFSCDFGYSFEKKKFGDSLVTC